MKQFKQNENPIQQLLKKIINPIITASIESKLDEIPTKNSE